MGLGAGAGAGAGGCGRGLGRGLPQLAKGGQRCEVRVRLMADERMQLAEHADHALHSDTIHGTGHDSVAHCSVSPSAGHATPPKELDRCTVRWRRRVPPPHVAEHAPKLPQADTTQSTGHAWVLQAPI